MLVSKGNTGQIAFGGETYHEEDPDDHDVNCTIFSVWDVYG